MNFRTETRLIGILGISLGLLGLFGPYVWRDMPHWLARAGVAFGIALFAWSALQLCWHSLPNAVQGHLLADRFFHPFRTGASSAQVRLPRMRWVADSIALAAVSVTAWYLINPNAYLYLRMNFPHPPEIWLQGKETMELTFANKSEDDIFVRDVHILEIRGTTRLYDKYRMLDMCYQSVSYSLATVDQVNPPGTGPIVGTNGPYQFSNHPIEKAIIDGREISFNGFRVAKHSDIEITADISVTPVDWQKFDSVALCVATRIDRVTSGQYLSLCPAVLDFRFPLSEKANILAMKPKEFLSFGADHTSQSIGELTVWKNSAFAIDREGGPPSCVEVR